MLRYKLKFSRLYETNYDRLCKNNNRLKQRIGIILKLLSLDPHHHSLKSHKVYAKDIGEAWSSSVTGDLRLIWLYDSDNRLIILVLNLGGHSGKNRVYN